MVNSSGLTAEQAMTKARVSLMNDPAWRWMAGIMTMGNVSYVDGDHRVQTGATDGVNEIYHRGFLASLTPRQVKYLALHENFHKMFRHLFIWQELFKQNAQIANIACDVVINNQQLAGKKDIEFIEGGVDMPQYADADVWNAKKIFDDLMKKAKEQPQSGGGKPQPGGAGGQDSLDEHMWEEAAELSPEEAKEIEKQVDVALRQAALAGNLGGGMPRSISEMLVPEVDWKSLLSEFVKSMCSGKDKQTWRTPHRTYLAYDLYLPRDYSDQVGRILIAGDTSGSINDRALSVFMGYMQQLCDEVHPDGVDIAWWDTQVRGVDSFERDSLHGLASAVKPAGGGGTTPACITDWIKKESRKDKYVCAVVVTDGEFYGDNVGDWDGLPVLWLVVNSRTIKPIPVGVTVQVGELK